MADMNVFFNNPDYAESVSSDRLAKASSLFFANDDILVRGSLHFKYLEFVLSQSVKDLIAFESSANALGSSAAQAGLPEAGLPESYIITPASGDFVYATDSPGDQDRPLNEVGGFGVNAVDHGWSMTISGFSLPLDTMRSLAKTGTLFKTVFAGKDTISLAGADDAFDAYGGDDTITDSGGSNTFHGGAGNDTITVSTFFGDRPGKNILFGDAGKDKITGADGADTIDGGAGADSLVGGLGKDVLKGGLGNDSLSGGLGRDTLYGGAGKDQFLFTRPDSTAIAAGRDLIADFSHAQADKIDLSVIDANVKQIGNQAFTFIGTAAFSKTAGEVRAATAAGDTFVYGDVDGDGKTDFSIQIDHVMTLVKGDFIL